MAFSTSKLIFSTVGRALNQGRQFGVLNKSPKYLLKLQHESQTSRAFARSMWNMCTGSPNGTGNQDDSSPGLLARGSSAKRVPCPSKTCSCGCGGSAALHTQADQELAKFLKEEIHVEQGSLENSPTMRGFEASLDGASVNLTKKMEGETISVKFNVNHSVEMAGGTTEEQEQQEEGPQMRSYPDFSVEISKGGSQSLRISCAYQRDNAMDDQEQAAEVEEEEDTFLIDEVLFAKKGAMADGAEATYRVGSEVMNEELYDHLKNVLADRGIDSEFCEHLSDFASAVEHRQYLHFLEELQSFIKH